MNTDAEANEANSDGSDSTNANLISDIVSSLHALENSDNELTEILAKHLLTMSPANDVVEKATNDIAQLASERAKESDK